MNGSNARISAEQLKGCLIDTHTHCGGMDLSNFYKGRYPTSQDILDLEEKRIRSGVDYQCVFPMATTTYYDIPAYWKYHVFQPSGYSEVPYQHENQSLLLQIRHFALSRQLPFLCFSLQDKIPEQEKEILRLAGEYPVYGLKHHTKVDQKNAECVDSESGFVALAAELGIPITFHTEEKGCSSAYGLLELADRNRNVRFCAAHFGGFSAKFLRELDQYPYDNLFLDTCPLLPRCADLSKKRSESLEDLDYSNPQAVLLHFAHRFTTRILWGTDAPWTYYGRLDASGANALREYGYERETAALRSAGCQQQMTDNAIRYLFGDGEV